MKNRRERIETIISLINNQCVGSQEELARLLANHGYHVTQATLSRDLRQLRTTKIPTEKGTYMYVLPSERYNTHHSAGQLAVRGLHGISVQGNMVTMSGNMVVIKTRNGHAPGLAYDLDMAACPDILGTIAGADTVFAVMKPGMDAAQVRQSLERIMPPDTVYRLTPEEAAPVEPSEPQNSAVS